MWPYPFWFAHRGGGRLAPENTLAAFRVGAAHGFRAFECDVKLSADGVPFLLHDSLLERTTSGTGAAGALGWSELSRLDAGGWHSPQFAGEPPASLEAVARYVRRNGLMINLEIKPMPDAAVVTGGAVASFVARRWAGEATVPLLSSFHPEALAAAMDVAPALPRSLLFEAPPHDWLEQALALRCRAAAFNHTAVDEALITRAHDAGLRVLAYTVNETADADRLRAAGIDGLFTDELQRFGAAAPA